MHIRHRRVGDDLRGNVYVPPDRFPLCFHARFPKEVSTCCRDARVVVRPAAVPVREPRVRIDQHARVPIPPGQHRERIANHVHGVWNGIDACPIRARKHELTVVADFEAEALFMHHPVMPTAQ